MIMKEYDSQKAARVWQRVQGEKQEIPVPPGSDNLQSLIMDQLQLSSMYQRLSGSYGGADGTALMRLAREARTQASCLRGLAVLMLGQKPEVRPAPMHRHALDAALRWCYGQELRLLKEYENRCNDPEYGPVFDRMVQRQREHCCIVLELIGSPQSK